MLSDLSCEVRENEIVGFLGPNGAGKTTTIKILNRLAFPDAGKVTLFGGQVRDGADVRRRIGFMPEQPYFYEYLTGGEFLRLCGQLCGMSRADTESRSSELLARVGLSGARDTAIRKYSKGMMQRLGLAQALLHDPELVILDEPMSGLDPMGRMEVRGIIRDLKAAGKTVFFSSHILSDVEALCDRVIMLHKGRKVAEGRVEELIGAETLYIELVVSPVLPADRLAAAGIPPEAGYAQGALLVLRAPDNGQANRWIAGLLREGCTVLSCVPVKKGPRGDLHGACRELRRRRGRRPDMFRRIFSIAANTFRETIRNKILYAILAFALFVIGMTFFLADLSVGDFARIIADVGLASIHIFGVIMAVFLGINLVSNEVDRKTIYILLSKPVRRFEFIFGKTLGLSVTLLLTTLAMATVLFLVHLSYRYGGRAEVGIFIASAGIYMELVLLTCLASLFSTFTTPVLSAIFTLSLFLVGHLTKYLYVLGEQSKEAAVRWGSRFLFYLLPNLENFNWKNEVAYGGLKSFSILGWAAGYLVGLRRMRSLPFLPPLLPQRLQMTAGPAGVVHPRRFGGVPRRRVHRIFPERGDPPVAARGVDRLPPVALPRLRPGDPGVGEYPHRRVSSSSGGNARDAGERSPGGTRRSNCSPRPGSRRSFFWTVPGSRCCATCSSSPSLYRSPSSTSTTGSSPTNSPSAGSPRDSSFPFSPAGIGRGVSRVRCWGAGSSMPPRSCTRRSAGPRGWEAATSSCWR